MFDLLFGISAFLFILSMILHACGKEKEAKWAFYSGILPLVLVFLLLKEGLKMILDQDKKRRRYD